MYKVYMKHTWILCLNLGLIPKISHYRYANIPKSKKTPNLKQLWSQAFQLKNMQHILWHLCGFVEFPKGSWLGTDIPGKILVTTIWRKGSFPWQQEKKIKYGISTTPSQDSRNLTYGKYVVTHNPVSKIFFTRNKNISKILFSLGSYGLWKILLLEGSKKKQCMCVSQSHKRTCVLPWAPMASQPGAGV